MHNFSSVQLKNLSWNEIPWDQVNFNVFELQKKIYQASLQKNYDILISLQSQLIDNFFAKLLSVKLITEQKYIKKK